MMMPTPKSVSCITSLHLSLVSSILRSGRQVNFNDTGLVFLHKARGHKIEGASIGRISFDA
jgi:hypothetical protein